jgi:hypothetical protein
LAVGPQEEIPDWVGTVTLDGETYGIAFFNTGTGKPFAEKPGRNLFFEETWTVYEELDFAFEDGFLVTFEPGDVLMSGYDSGVSVSANSTFRMSGDIRVANGEFAAWLGRGAHMMGAMELYPPDHDHAGLPHRASGPFRAN